MATDLSIRCKCGAVRGAARKISPAAGNRVVCYCDDCQAFAHALGAARITLDAQGGTDIFQMSQSHLELTNGRKHLACLRLTPRGTFRWYADCCKTPIGNTLPTGQLPFVGLIHACIDAEGRSLDELLGPVRARVMTRFARGRVHAAHTHNGFPVPMVAGVFLRILGWRLRGDHRRSPFFDPGTGEAAATPHVLGVSGRV